MLGKKRKTVMESVKKGSQKEKGPRVTRGLVYNAKKRFKNSGGRGKNLSNSQRNRDSTWWLGHKNEMKKPIKESMTKGHVVRDVGDNQKWCEKGYGNSGRRGTAWRWRKHSKNDSN